MRIELKLATVVLISLVTSLIPIYYSVVGYPREGISASTAFHGSEQVYIVDLVFLYRGDKVSFTSFVESEDYSVYLFIKGVFSGRQYNWESREAKPNPVLPLFIPEQNDWYLITIAFKAETGKINVVEFSYSVYETERQDIANTATRLFPFIVGILAVFLAVTEMLKRKNRGVRYLQWSLSSSYKWVLGVIAFTIYLLLTTDFSSQLSPYYTYLSITPMTAEEINGYYLLDGIYHTNNVDRVLEAILLTTLLVNLILVSYYLDKKYYRIDFSIGNSPLNIFLLRWLEGYILLAIPYILAKIYTDIVIYGDLSMVLEAYHAGLLTRLLVDVYTIFFYYTIFYSISIVMRNMSVALPVLFTLVMIYNVFKKSSVVKSIYYLPWSVREHLLMGCVNILECLSQVEVVVFAMPFTLFFVGAVAVKMLDWH